jgi:hypothetical protein
MRVALLSFVAAAFAVSEKATPVEKVIELLTDLKNQTEEEAKKEAEVYDNFACFCKDKTAKKSDDILASQTLIDEQSARKEEQEGIRDARIKTIADLNKEIDTLTQEMKDAEEAFLAEKAKREAVIADLRKAVYGLKGAITAVEESKPAALLTFKSTIQKNLLVAEALGMASGKKVAAALVQMSDDGDRYEFHGSAILETLNDLKEEFETKLSDEETELAKVKKAHEALMKAKSDRVTAATDELNTATDEKEDAVKQIGEATKMLTEESVVLTDAQAYLKEMTSTCELKARTWDQRSATRNGEIAALTQALEIMEGTVKGKDEAANKRAFLNQRRSILKKAGSSAVDMNEDEVGDLSFVQVSSRSARVANMIRSSSKKQQVVAQLRATAQKLDSRALFDFAGRLKAEEGPFDKIKKLIAQLIERLLTESAEEASHKGWCDSELMKARKERDFKQADAEDLNSTLESNEATRDQEQANVDKLTEQLSDLEAAVAEAEENRTAEKETNMQTLSDAKEGFSAVKQALQVLKDFYKGKHGVGGADSETVSLLQDPRHDMPEVADGAYQGNQDQAGGILGLLEVIKTDFERTIKDTTASEKQASREHVKFMRESKTSESSWSTEKKNSENTVTAMKNAIKSAMADLKSTMELMDTAVKQIEELKPACIDTGMSYEERVAKREEEIAALKTALCQLDPEGVEAEC